MRSQGRVSRSDQPLYRPLRVYAFDPTLGRTLGNYMTVNVPFEDLDKGPIGQYLEIIDYDASNDCYYPPVDLNQRSILLEDGLAPDESNPQFHQQMVYAVASETIRRFEHALGRRVRWAFGRHSKHKRLRILPHAMLEANAFYSEELAALVFGYFAATEEDEGLNLPGQTVFTCLSHDIIAHETTHALVHSQRSFLTEPTGPDAPAFHEAFADMVALFQHFSYKDALLETIQRTGGRIYRTDLPAESTSGPGGPLLQSELTGDNPIVGLARQFGYAVGLRKSLRAALGTPPNTRELEKYSEPHRRGSILVAAIFDAYFSAYVRRISDLMRISQAAGMQLSSGNLHPDLANRLAETAAKTAGHFLNICIRALDYCPPVDITFGDFLRAMITADYDMVPDDEHEYRTAVIHAFRSRGIVPGGAASYSEESLLWQPPEVGANRVPPVCSGLDFDVWKSESAGQEQAREENNAKVLHSFADDNRTLLHLSPSLPIETHTFHVVNRVSVDGKILADVVTELIQRRAVLTDPDDPDSPKFNFLGGTTLILAKSGELRYAVYKPVGEEKDDADNARLKRQRDYLTSSEADISSAAYATPEELQQRLKNFAAIHRGY
ncbi:MAG: hypothetical protein LYZ69_02825 [Nitrososphaerales archaeon]|nr:hypothetical protein [Nitrososphaerales archaeon]